MAETEKEGRPPENKRSRKPAHPVKREINEEMKVKKRAGVGVVVEGVPAARDCACGSRVAAKRMCVSVEPSVLGGRRLHPRNAKRFGPSFISDFLFTYIAIRAEPELRTSAAPPRTIDAASIHPSIHPPPLY